MTNIGSQECSLGRVVERDFLPLLEEADSLGTDLESALVEALRGYGGDIPFGARGYVDVEVGIRESPCGCRRYLAYPPGLLESTPYLTPLGPFRVFKDGRAVHLSCGKEVMVLNLAARLTG
jgi:hypothetical protein